tara:strand:- start:155 stop:418 length:264 start_codon:yes stop_codon:yes gene_type:complete
MPKFRKKPVVIEAVQWTGSNMREVDSFMDTDTDHGDGTSFVVGAEVKIATLEGVMTAGVGDWIIKGVNGEFYPCKPDIFEKTYEAVE